jgi:hypothetical protein
MRNWTKTRTLLALCSLCLLAGCLQEDTITITKDGLVKFEAVVTEPDTAKKIEFAALQKVIANGTGDLEKHGWKVEETWTSKERPYRVKITGSGKLPDVVGDTAFYKLRKVKNKQVKDQRYKFIFLASETNQMRIAFNSPDGVVITDAAGKPVQEVENASPKDVYTIVLK